MTKEKFREMVLKEMENLKENKKKAVCFYVESEELINELNDIIYSADNFDETYEGYIDDAPYVIKRHFDEHEYNVVWLYKYSCIGLLIKGLYGLPYCEYNTLKGLLLGTSIDELENQYVNDDEFDEVEFDHYSDNYYKPIHPLHRTYDKVIFDDKDRDKHAPYTHAVYWEDTGNPRKPEFIEVEDE